MSTPKNLSRFRLSALIAVAVLTLSACGGSDTTDAKADTEAAETPAETTAADKETVEALPVDQYCALAIQLNDIDVADENPDPAEVKKFIKVTGQLAASAPSQIKSEAAEYFGKLGELAEQGEASGLDLETLPKDMQDAFGKVAAFTMQHCDK